MAHVVDTPARPSGTVARIPVEIAGDKFAVPPLPGTFGMRPRLQQALITASTKPLTLVVGPIGAGKTTLLASYAHSRPRGATAWCRLDARDSDPFVFGISVLQAILTARKSSGIDQLVGVRASSPDPLDQAIELAVHGPDLVLILDDVEQLHTRAGRAALQRLVQQTPHGLSTMLATRHDPDLHHHTFRRAEHTTLRAADLAFTVPEAAALFERCGAVVSEDEARTLTTWTK